MSKNYVILFVISFLFYVNCSNENPSILIIGSGPSGIAAATRLWKNNFTNLRILEAENRIGGRVNSVKFGDAYIDLGAEWCHGEKDNIVYNMVKEYNILKHPTNGVEMYYSNGTLLEGLYDNLVEFSESLDASIDNYAIDQSCSNFSSIGECFDSEFNSTFIKLYENNTDLQRISLEAASWLQYYMISYDSCSTLHELSMRSSYKRCEGDLALNWDGRGYKTILEVMLQKYPDPTQELPIDITLNKKINRIIWDNNSNKVQVLCSDNSTYSADHIIFTPSLGVLKADHESMFKPALPKEKVAAIKNIGFGAVMKIILHFPHTWWNTSQIYAFVWSTDDVAKIRTEFGQGPETNGRSWLTTNTCFFTAEQNPSVLIGFFAGEMIAEMEQTDDEVLKSGCMYMFRKFLGANYSNITDPDDIIKSTWHANPHFRGTYSYENTKTYEPGLPDKLASPLLRENGDPAVMFAGEATHPHHFSTVHGAIECGYREADRLIEYYDRRQ